MSKKQKRMCFVPQFLKPLWTKHFPSVCFVVVTSAWNWLQHASGLTRINHITIMVAFIPVILITHISSISGSCIILFDHWYFMNLKKYPTFFELDIFPFYSFPFKLVTMSSLFTFLANNLETIYETTNVPIAAYMYDGNLIVALKSYLSDNAILNIKSTI